MQRLLGVATEILAEDTVAEASVPPVNEVIVVEVVPVADEQAVEPLPFVTLEQQWAKLGHARLWQSAILEGDFQQLRPVAIGEATLLEQLDKQRLGAWIRRWGGGHVVSYGQCREELE